MKQLIVSLASLLVLGATLLAPVPAYAWMTNQSASAVCEGADSAISWSFTNTEPNEPKWSMDIVVKNSNGGQQGPFTVAPGQTKSGEFAHDGSTGAGTITFDLTWTDGHSGVDTRTASYTATDCVEEPRQIEVCRDGEVITIDEKDRKETDTDAPCPEEPKTIQVCRDGKLITINEDERKSTDTDACVLDEEDLPKELPNTGLGSVLSGFAGTSALGLGVREWINSRKSLRRGLLSR